MILMVHVIWFYLLVEQNYTNNFQDFNILPKSANGDGSSEELDSFGFSFFSFKKEEDR